MTGKLIENASLREQLHVFEDRIDAGKRLATQLKEIIKGDEIVLGIPAGGVPVALEIARALALSFDLLIVRKIQLPWNPEAGFGAVDPDGHEVFNRELLMRTGLTDREIRAQVEKTLAVIKQRNQAFRKDRPFPDLTHKAVIIVDDGLASGYTMLAALKFIKRRNPRKIVVAVPTALDRTVDFILPRVDNLVCLNIRGGFTFAVANAYRNWYDLTDEGVISLMEWASAHAD